MPRYKYFLSRNVKKQLDFFLDSQYWTRDKIYDYQTKKLKDLIIHAYKYVPYYKKILDVNAIKPEDIKSLEDLNKIPILRKEDIKSNLTDLISSSISKNNLIFNYTGGSTGVPLKFFHDKSYMVSAEAMRIRNWKYFVGFDMYESEAILWGDVRDIGKGLSLSKFIKFLLKPDISLNTFDLDENKILNFFRFYNLVQPNIVRGYASSLYFISEILTNNKFKFKSPKSVISSSETLTVGMKKKISKVFGSKIYNSYGSREVSQIAMECEFGNMHISLENQIVELVPNTMFSKEGLMSIIVTNLNNYGMPFIRYEIGDVAKSIISSQCNCGRSHDLILGLGGRVNENIKLKDGKVINGEYFEFLFDDIHDVDRYQVVYYSSLNKLLLKLDAKNNHEIIKNNLKSKLKSHLGTINIEFDFESVFEKSPTGNFKFVWNEE